VKDLCFSLEGCFWFHLQVVINKHNVLLSGNKDTFIHRNSSFESVSSAKWFVVFFFVIGPQATGDRLNIPGGLFKVRSAPCGNCLKCGAVYQFQCMCLHEGPETNSSLRLFSNAACAIIS